jgi:hypothetical protein
MLVWLPASRCRPNSPAAVIWGGGRRERNSDSGLFISLYCCCCCCPPLYRRSSSAFSCLSPLDGGHGGWLQAIISFSYIGYDEITRARHQRHRRQQRRQRRRRGHRRPRQSQFNLPSEKRKKKGHQPSFLIENSNQNYHGRNYFAAVLTTTSSPAGS